MKLALSLALTAACLGLVAPAPQSAGHNAESLALSSGTTAGEPNFGGHYNLDAARNTLNYGGGIGSLVATSPDGRHSLRTGLYGQQSVTGGNSLTFSDPNIGAAAGYRFDGDRNSFTAGLHQQTFGNGVSEHGGSLGVEHRLNDWNTVHAGVSRSNFDYPGPFSSTDTTVGAGYRFNLNNRASLNVGAHRTTSDFGPFRRNNNGFSLGGTLHF